MRANRHSIHLASTLLLLAAAAVAPADPSLKVGSPAPAMQVSKWIKGKPVPRLERGKVYVVEFWATWCGPCIESIPHLTALAKKYAGRATFAGISAFEEREPKDEKYFERVQKFVRDMGPKMDYSVGIDGKAGAMAKSWMEAAEQTGIPTAFVVDRQGRIAWIGHPMGELDRVVGEVVDGKFDPKAEQARAAAARSAQEKRLQELAPLTEALRKGDHKAAVAEMDRLMASDPEAALGLAVPRLKSLLHFDEPAAYAYARTLAEGPFKSDPQTLNEIAWAIVDDEAPVKNGDYKLAIEIAQRGVSVQKEDDPHLAYILDTLAYAHFKSGNVDRALELQQKALDACERFGDKIPAATKQELLDRMVMFRKKKGGGL